MQQNINNGNKENCKLAIMDISSAEFKIFLKSAFQMFYEEVNPNNIFIRPLARTQYILVRNIVCVCFDCLQEHCEEPLMFTPHAASNFHLYVYSELKTVYCYTKITSIVLSRWHK